VLLAWVECTSQHACPELEDEPERAACMETHCCEETAAVVYGL